MSVYSLCAAARSASPEQAFGAQTAASSLLAVCELLVCAASVVVLRRVPVDIVGGGGWLKRMFDVFMYKFVARAASVSVNQFRRTFLVLVAAAGFFAGASWIVFNMVHKWRFVFSNTNTTDVVRRDEVSPPPPLPPPALPPLSLTRPSPAPQALAAVDSWAAAYYAIQPLAPLFFRRVHMAACASLALPSPPPLLHTRWSFACTAPAQSHSLALSCALCRAQALQLQCSRHVTALPSRLQQQWAHAPLSYVPASYTARE